jgi:putative ABC transport system permease protein
MEIGPITRALLRNKMRFALIVLQIAVTLAVVTNAVNMIYTERKDMIRPSGFDDENLLWVRSRPFAPEFDKQEYRIASAESDLRALRGIPGVRYVVNTNFLPWQGGGSSGDVKVAGGDGSQYRTQEYSTTPGILQTLDVKLVSGRDLKESDVDDDSNSINATVLISRALEKLAFKGQSAVGRQFTASDGGVYTVAGVFDPFYNPYGWPIHEYCMFFAGHVSRSSARYLIRVEPGALKQVAGMVEKRLIATNDGRNVELRPIPAVKDRYFTQGRIVIWAMSMVIVLIVVVTGLGIAGVTSFSVTERTRQIGTRRALGATKPAIVRHFLMENWIITNSGLILGVVLAYALNYLLVTHTSGVKLDWRFVAAGVLLLWAQGIAATLLPASRAAAVPPVIATRTV